MKRLLVVMLVMLVILWISGSAVKAVDTMLSMGFMISGEYSETKSPIMVPIFLRLYLPQDNVNVNINNKLAFTGTHIPINAQAFPSLPFELSTGVIGIDKLVSVELAFANNSGAPEKIGEGKWIPMQSIGGQCFKFVGNTDQLLWGPNMFLVRVKHNNNKIRNRVLFFTITFMSRGEVSSAYVLNIQDKPVGLDWINGSREEFFQYLRGFLFGEAEPANLQVIETKKAEREAKLKLKARPVIKQFRPCAPYKVLKGTTIEVVWDTERADQVLLNKKPVTTCGSGQFLINETTTFNLEAIGKYEKVTASFQVEVLEPTPPTPKPAPSPSPSPLPDKPQESTPVVAPEEVSEEPEGEESSATGTVVIHFWDDRACSITAQTSGVQVLVDRVRFGNKEAVSASKGFVLNPGIVSFDVCEDYWFINLKKSSPTIGATTTWRLEAGQTLQIHVYKRAKK